MSSGFQVGVFVDTEQARELDLFRGIVRHAEAHKWRIIVGEEILSLSPSALSVWAIDGVLGFLRDRKFIEAVRRSRIKAVNASFIGAGAGIPSVIPDRVKAGRMAAQFFIERGYRHFAYIVETSLSFHDRKQQGFWNHLSEAGFPCTVLRRPTTLPKNRTWAQLRLDLVKLLRQLPKPVGVFARTDQLAARAVGACEAGRIQVPDEVAIIGCGDDRNICRYTHPPLASIAIDYETVGFQAAQLLQKMMEGERGVPQTVYVQPRPVIVRGSCDAMAQVDPQLGKALAYIERHACDPAWVEDVLRHMGMNRRHLERLFKRHLHRSPNTEIVRVRVGHAQKLLAETDTALPEVATACGFATYSSLSGAFKRITGVTPRTYRKSPR